MTSDFTLLDQINYMQSKSGGRAEVRLVTHHGGSLSQYYTDVQTKTKEIQTVIQFALQLMQTDNPSSRYVVADITNMRGRCSAGTALRSTLYTLSQQRGAPTWFKHSPKFPNFIFYNNYEISLFIVYTTNSQFATIITRISQNTFAFLVST